jgi:hypothetical protein
MVVIALSERDGYSTRLLLSPKGVDGGCLFVLAA